ncbi:hypothetical protein [Variovorax sp. DT-64]|uniref:hypothetical protein n=1 Tax=Variovorax sp. DT-64 TaxID=3396160 RepID=UPI003F1CCB50
MNINMLARKAAKPGGPAAYGGAVEVEDMIRFVLLHGEAAADEIERLSSQHGWLMDGMVLPDGILVRPMGRWAQTCVAFGRGGVVALRPQLDDQTRRVLRPPSLLTSPAWRAWNYWWTIARE